MSIETSTAVAAPRSRAAHTERMARNPSTPADSDTPATGFSALLGAAAEAPEPEPTAPDNSADRESGDDSDDDTKRASRSRRAAQAGADGAAPADAAALAAWGAMPKTPVDPPAAVATGAGTATSDADAAALATAGAVLGGRFALHAPPAAGGTDANGLTGLAQARNKLQGLKAGKPTSQTPADLGAQTAVPADPTAAANQAGKGAAAALLADGNARATLAGAQQLRVNQLATQAATDRAQAAVGTGAAGAAADASALGAVALSTSTTPVAADQGVRGAASTMSLADGNAARWASVLSEIARPQAEAGAGGFSGGGSRSGQGGGAQSQGSDGLASAAIGFAPTASAGDNGFQSTASAAGAQGVPGDGAMSTDELLAATTPSLHSREVQNAELTVDAFGAPVDVRISLQGSEAQVAFQSDQADTRAMLGGAVSELQNLLQREGLVLSNVTVGDSGAQANGQATGEGGSRGESRRSQRADKPSIEVAAAATGTPRPSAGRGALDLYA
ncbi:hypothetical protein GT347_08015 [Xylophilus rhododendri]|uniref:Flagellar hook-length control protein-like C-terminal domain-containing protein n=1 Tax=Xylophilus rhododendri TaxID=2697032 RepID=A0A857J4H9_9BURK|nr:flagellar hook-length control protein FliK [Xylophilus rhododendri]QHI97941.1 hypothetical protein GT347_08015 [Xylophilus rhododendri]